MLSAASFSNVISDAGSKLRDITHSKFFQVSFGAAFTLTTVYVISSAPSNLNSPFLYRQALTPDSALKTDQYVNQAVDLFTEQTSLFDSSSWCQNDFMSNLADQTCSPAFFNLAKVVPSNSEEAALEAPFMYKSTGNSLTSVFKNAFSANVLDTYSENSRDVPPKLKKIEPLKFEFPLSLGVCNVSNARFAPKAPVDLSARASSITESVKVESSYDNLYLGTAGGAAILGSLAFLCWHREKAPTVLATSIAATIVVTQSMYRAAKQRVNSWGVDYGLWGKKIVLVRRDPNTEQRIVLDGASAESFKDLGDAIQRESASIVEIYTKSVNTGKQAQETCKRSIKIANQFLNKLRSGQ